MADKLLINVAHEETRVALVESGRLANFEIITSRADNNKGNIYKGIVHRVNTSLQAAFVDYGADKQGFLPVPEIHERFYPKHLVGKKVSIQDVLHQGQEIMVQVVKDEIGQKGAGLTTFISVAGRSLAIEANSDKAGISRRVSDDERKRLKKVMNTLDVPEGHGAIMRTAAADQTDDAIQDNHKYLMMVLNKLNERFAAMKGPGLVHQERGLAVRFIRDYVPSNIDEVLIDEREAWEEVKNFCNVLAPELVSRVKLYDDPRPLFSRYQVEDQIDDIFARRIDLPSGGSIVIDQTEALVAIDVNSGRVKTDDIEDTALKTNLEAAAEVARQLKIRDRGGLIVVDFIDMRDKDNIRKVEDAVRDGFRSDKAKVKFSKISEFGLMEISRQRLQGSVMRGSFTPCGTCGGTGQVRSVESSALYLLRRMKETLIRGNYQHLDAQMPVAIANYLLNRKRKELVDLEKQTGTSIEVRAEASVPAMQSYFELISRSSNQARRPKRILQQIDLVRSEVEKRELEEGEEIRIEGESGSEEAEVSVFAAAREKLEAESKSMEAELARAKELERAQKEADESLRREAELRAQKEVLLAEAERIRAMEDARWKGLSIWSRLKVWFGGGLPPLSMHGEVEGDERTDRVKLRERREDRDERRRKRSERDDDRGEKGERPADKGDKGERPADKADKGERPGERPADKADKGERGERRDDRGDRKDRDRRGRDRDRDRKDKDKDKEKEGERPSLLMDAGGAAAAAAALANENGKKKRRRRRRGKNGEEIEDGAEGEFFEGDEPRAAVAKPPEVRDAKRDGRDGRDSRDGRDGRSGQGDRSRDGRPASAERNERNDRNERPDIRPRAPEAGAPAAMVPAAVIVPATMVVATPAAPAVPLKFPKFGAIDLRGGTPKVVPASELAATVPAAKTGSSARPLTEAPAMKTGEHTPLPKAFGAIDLRAGSKPAEPKAETPPAIPAPPAVVAQKVEAAPAPEVLEEPLAEVEVAVAPAVEVVEAPKPEAATAKPTASPRPAAAPRVSAAQKAENKVTADAAAADTAAKAEATPAEPKPRETTAKTARPAAKAPVEAKPVEEAEAAEGEGDDAAEGDESDDADAKKRRGRGRRGGRGRGKKGEGDETAAEPSMADAKE